MKRGRNELFNKVHIILKMHRGPHSIANLSGEEGKQEHRIVEMGEKDKDEAARGNLREFYDKHPLEK